MFMNKLPVKNKIAYGLGDLATNIMFQSSGILMLYYYTDVFHISASIAGTIFLVARLIDAVVDPVIGYTADKTRTRWGRYRPYVFWGAFPLGITMILIFFTPDLSHYGKIIYAFVTYTLFSVMSTLVYIPYSALTSAITSDFHERSSISGYRQLSAVVGGFIVSVVSRPFIALFRSEEQGFLFMAITYAVVAMVIYAISAVSVRETVRPVSEHKPPLLLSFTSLFRNRPFILLAFGVVFGVFASNMFSTLLYYYFKYYINNEKLISTAFMCLMGPIIIAIPFWLYISRRIGKRKTYLVGVSFVSIAQMAIFFLGSRQISLHLIWFGVLGFGGASGGFAIISMLADVVDFGEWKFGLRTEGLIYGFEGLLIKGSIGISKALSGWGLDAFGYQANVTQSAMSLWGIRFMTTLGPLLINLLAILCFWLYTLDDKMLTQIRADLAERRSLIREAAHA